MLSEMYREAAAEDAVFEEEETYKLRGSNMWEHREASRLVTLNAVLSDICIYCIRGDSHASEVIDGLRMRTHPTWG